MHEDSALFAKGLSRQQSRDAGNFYTLTKLRDCIPCVLTRIH